MSTDMPCRDQMPAHYVLSSKILLPPIPETSHTAVPFRTFTEVNALASCPSLFNSNVIWDLIDK
jgi:hypothetical protein